MKLRVNMRVLKGMAVGLSVLMLLMAAALLLRNLDLKYQGQDTAPACFFERKREAVPLRLRKRRYAGADVL